jgi:hypothetical protein
MATTNPINQVLVPSGNQALLGAGSRVSSLLNGQVGVFNFHTGLSVDGTVPADCKDIFIAVGINRTTGGTDAMEDFAKSSGQMIQVRHASALTVKAYVPEIAQVEEITNFTVKCETDYNVKVEFRNGKSYGVNGYNQFTKTFNYRTGCCAPTTDCDDCSAVGSNVELVQGLVTAINADTDALLVASMFGWKITATVNGAPTSDANTVVTIGTTTYTVAVLDADTTAQAAAKIVAVINTQVDSPYKATLSGSIISVYRKTVPTTNTETISVTGAGVTMNTIVAATKTTVTDSAGFAVAYPDAALGLRLTGAIATRPAANGSINLNYYKTGTKFIVSLVEDFGGFSSCNGTVTNITQLQYPEGKGYDIQQLEYAAGGWNGKPGPYRTNSVTGLQKNTFEYFASATANYTLIYLAYNIKSVGGWEEYENNLLTTIAIPCADSTTLQGLFTVLDLIFTQFGAFTNDVAGIDCTNTGTSGLAANVDGIESIAG